MQELRLAAVSEDGTYLVLATAGRGTRFMLPVDDRLRAAVRGQFSRLGQYEIEVENPLRPKEIQARIRSGETAESISEVSGIPIERVRWFEGPVLQEREYIAQQAQRASVRRQGEATPGPLLGDLVTDRVGGHQLETGDAAWDAWKREDNTWQLRLSYLARGEARVAHWIYEPRRRSVTAFDEEADRFSGPAEPAADPGPANVTPFVPRRSGSEPAQQPAQPPAQHYGEPRGQEPRGQEQRPADPRARELWPSEPRPSRAEPPAAQRTGAPAPAPAGEPAPRHRPDPLGAPPPARTPVSPGRAPVTGPPAAPQRSEPAPAAQPRQPERPERSADPAPRPERRERPPMAPPTPQRSAPAAAGEGDGTRTDSSAPVPAAAAGGVAPATPEPPRRKGRGRRASVPSWDEIMFGAKKSD
ncbi:Protein of unknown function (DUF3071) [Murinocardiopsis flavida]|uniref:DUF3071 domain-containing protein n=1 Tax=Murinocardiopsis flavida TaxID=645275 RepID=A0A2P8CGU9_9ACTN|nr:septation protein SepH [Murinocardiopsis flavida]PSK84214.1 Protein of unknown function (DUF3071) [Murinocardiopsis flavida]